MIAKKTKLTGAMKGALLDDALGTLYDKDLRKAMNMAKTAAEYQIEEFFKSQQLKPNEVERLTRDYSVTSVTLQHVMLTSCVDFVDHSGEKNITRRAYAPHDEIPYVDRNEICYSHKDWLFILKEPVTLPVIGKYASSLHVGGGYWNGKPGNAPPRITVHYHENHDLGLFRSNPFIYKQVINAYLACYRYETDSIALIENFRALLRAAKTVEMVQEFYPRAKDICAPLEVTPGLPTYINTALLDRMKGMEFDPVKQAA